MFFFVAGGKGKTELGEYEIGQASAAKIKISQAVAASSSFPPAFPPLPLTQDDYPNDSVDYVTLTDGGVYDNLGVNPLLRTKRNNLQYALVSDGGKPFDIIPDPTDSGSIVLKEAIGILMEQVRGLQFERLKLAHSAGGGPKPLWWSIDSAEGKRSMETRPSPSLIGTNLKKLSEAEMTVLTRHAGALCQARIEKYAPELIA